MEEHDTLIDRLREFDLYLTEKMNEERKTSYAEGLESAIKADKIIDIYNSIQKELHENFPEINQIGYEEEEVMENALELKSFLESKRLKVILDIEPDRYRALSESPRMLHERTFEIIKDLGLKKVTIIGYACVEERSDRDLGVYLDLNGSNPKQEFQIFTSNFPGLDFVSYTLSFPKKYENLGEFLKKNEFINKKYEEIEQIYKNCFGLTEKDVLNEAKPRSDWKHQFRIRSHSDDCINARDHIAVSGNKEIGYFFSVRYALTKNPDAAYKAIKDSQVIVNNFFKQK